MKFPEIPKEYFWDFVRGYFDGDGCVSINREKYIYIIFSSGSKKFLEGLRDDLVLQGLSYKEVGQQRGRTTHFLNYQRKEDVLTLYKGMYHKDVLPCLSRKRQQFLRFFSSDKSTICPDCGTVLQRTGRCSICMACGWSVCEF
jgi:intein/homing endonuclease